MINNFLKVTQPRNVPLSCADGTEGGQRARVGKQLTETAQGNLCPNNEKGASPDLLNSFAWKFELAAEGENCWDCRRSRDKTYSGNAVEQNRSGDGGSQMAEFLREKAGDSARVCTRRTLGRGGGCQWRLRGGAPHALCSGAGLQNCPVRPGLLLTRGLTNLTMAATCSLSDRVAQSVAGALMRGRAGG